MAGIFQSIAIVIKQELLPKLKTWLRPWAGACTLRAENQGLPGHTTKDTVEPINVIKKALGLKKSR